jgi:serine/threonine-protein kinase
MLDDPRIQKLLEELVESQRTPEEVCGSCPELVSVVRKWWWGLRRIRSALGSFFPTADMPIPAGMPHIPGYAVESVLGRGGMGVVFRARHLRLNRFVALKMLLCGAYCSPSELTRFRREMDTVASLRHENIVRIYDMGDHDGRPYFTMEYVQGGSLAHKLSTFRPTARDAAGLLATLAAAVQAIHQAGIVHRDLKPANILLSLEGAPKIADFGLARHFQSESDLTPPGDRLGTPAYMAPEQVMGKTRSIGPLVDIYALGALLYELLTGGPPFRGETAAETELQVIRQGPVPPSRLSARVPRELEAICLKCLRKEPQRRYASAAALSEDLVRYLGRRGIQQGATSGERYEDMSAVNRRTDRAPAPLPC